MSSQQNVKQVQPIAMSQPADKKSEGMLVGGSSERMPAPGSSKSANGATKKRVDPNAVANGPTQIAPQVGQSRKVIQKPQGISPSKKSSMGIANERAPGANGKADLAVRDPDGARRDGGNSEFNLFNKHYNKELKLCEDEIPMVLCELNESALAYLGREQYENALLLLQKAHGVLDVVDLSGSRRDLYIALQLFHNMAMCYQKQGQLEECALCLETTLDHLGTDYASEKNQSFAMRCFKMKLEVKLRLQFCAILSQLHRHKEAFEQALEGIKISHLIVRDKIAVCRYYSKRLELNDQFGISGSESLAHDQSQRGGALSESASQSESNKKRAKSGMPSHRKKREIDGTDAVSKSSFPFEEDMQAGQFQSCRIFDDVSVESLRDLQTEQAIYNNLEGSISIHERVAKKLLPIYKSLLYKVQQLEKRRAPSPDRAGQKNRGGRTDNERDTSAPNENGRGGRLLDFHDGAHSANDSSDGDSKSLAENLGRGAGGGLTRPSSGKAAAARSKSGLKRKRSNNARHMVVKGPVTNVDLRHILGFLNQTEWIQNLNIGNIMQIAPLKQEEMTALRRNEEMLSRESFLDIISFLIVGYFCASTEIRFIIQLKDEISKFEHFSVEGRTQESELWHTMSLDIACSFLPSDCPLLNHILLSYQKHHAPSQTKIPENAALEERLRVIKPQTGIDNSKFHPIIRVLSHIKVDLPLAKMEPAQKRVNKLLRSAHEKFKLSLDRASQLQKKAAKSEVKTQYQQQSQKETAAAKLTNRQAMKLLKLEKLVSKYAKEVNVDKKTILRFLLGDQEETSMQRRLDMQQMSYKSVQSFTNGYHPAQPGRPQSHHEQLSARRLESAGGESNTGQAAKMAYHNIKQGDNVMASSGAPNIQSKSPSPGLTSIGSKSQLNNPAAVAGASNWKMSPQSYMDSRNAKTVQAQGATAAALTASAELEQERLLPQGAPDGATAPSAPMRSQRQPKTAGGPTSVTNDRGERKHDSEINSLRDNSFMHDLSQSNLHLGPAAPHHDRSFNDVILDERSRLLLNQSDLHIDNNHHNQSIGAIGGTNSSMIQAGRASNKRGSSHERVGGKVQRPRSSKGYRGNLQPGPHGAGPANGTSGQILEQQRASSNTASAQKFHSTKSEERALKTSQNQRSLVTKNPRQKTAGTLGQSTGVPNSTTHNASHTSHGFNKNVDALTSVNSSIAPTNSVSALQSKKLASISSQLQSQSSSQLVSGQNTGNMKLSKKQLAQIQAAHQQQNAFNIQSASTSALAPPAGLVLGSSSNQQNVASSLQFNSVQSNVKKAKMNYEDLKKFLMKDPNGNANAHLQQLMANQATQSQQNFLPNQLGGDQSSSQQEMLSRGRSQPGLGKAKKMSAQSQSQVNQQLQLKEGQHNLATSATTGNLIAMSDVEAAGAGKNRDIKEFYKRSTDEDKDVANSQAHKKLAAAKSRSQTGTGPSSKRTQQEQIYLNSLSVHPNSQQVSHRGGSREGTGAAAGRSLNAQGANGHQSQPSGGQYPQHQLSNQNQQPIKRREIKGRLMMQEWLTKSGTNLPPANAVQNNQANLSQQQFTQLGPQGNAQSQPVSGKGNNKFLPKQLMAFDASQAPLTKQQQNHLLHMQMAQSSTSANNQQPFGQKPMPPPGSAEQHSGLVAAGSSLNSRGASKEREGRRRSQPQ